MPRRRRKRQRHPDAPRTRADCVDGFRPCPWVSCRYHLLLYVRADGTFELAHHKGITGRKRAIRPTPEEEAAWIKNAVNRLSRMEESCALDVAARGGLLPSEIAKLAGLTKQRISQIESALRERLRAEGQEDGEAGTWLAMALEDGVIEWPS